MLISSVTHVELEVRESEPLQIVIEALGCSSPKQSEGVRLQPSGAEKGIYTFDYLATESHEDSDFSQTSSIAQAKFVLEDIPPDFRGVKIKAESNMIERHIDLEVLVSPDPVQSDEEQLLKMVTLDQIQITEEGVMVRAQLPIGKTWKDFRVYLQTDDQNGQPSQMTIFRLATLKEEETTETVTTLFRYKDLGLTPFASIKVHNPIRRLA